MLLLGKSAFRTLTGVFDDNGIDLGITIGTDLGIGFVETFLAKINNADSTSIQHCKNAGHLTVAVDVRFTSVTLDEFCLILLLQSGNQSLIVLMGFSQVCVCLLFCIQLAAGQGQLIGQCFGDRPDCLWRKIVQPWCYLFAQMGPPCFDDPLNIILTNHVFWILHEIPPVVKGPRTRHGVG